MGLRVRAAMLAVLAATRTAPAVAMWMEVPQAELLVQPGSLVEAATVSIPLGPLDAKDPLQVEVEPAGLYFTDYGVVSSLSVLAGTVVAEHGRMPASLTVRV